MTERFNNAYNALVKAFYNGTLAKGTCAACACGNIAANSWNIEIPKNLWFENSTKHERLAIKLHNIWSKGINNKTGYSIEELKRIENAFERNSKINWTEYKQVTEQEILEDQFEALSAVTTVLLALDNIKPEEHYKQKFREHPKLQTV